MAPPNPRKRSGEEDEDEDTNKELVELNRKRKVLDEEIRMWESKQTRYQKKLRRDIDEAGSHEVPSGAVVGTSQGRAASNYHVIPEKESVDLFFTVGTLTSQPTSSKPTQDLLMETNHEKVIRSIDFLPSNPSHFVTSDNGGWIQKTQLRSISTSPRAKDILYFNASINGLFPVSVSVNPFDESLVAVYGQSERLAIWSLQKDKELGEVERVQVIKRKPHEAGVEQVSFMPWINKPTFLSCGKRHDIVSWGKKGSKWEPNGSPYKLHSNSITGIAGAFHMPWVISVGKDRKMLVYDLQNESKVKDELIDEPCLGVAVNPCDYNLVCVQTSEVDGQLRLFDLRQGQGFTTQLATRVTNQYHEFGWEYDNKNLSRSVKDPNSALVRPSWSSTGLLLSCGSAESDVKIFDIRYIDSRNPVFIFRKHTGKVYQVAWAPSRSILVTASADHMIGLVKWK